MAEVRDHAPIHLLPLEELETRLQPPPLPRFNVSPAPYRLPQVDLYDASLLDPPRPVGAPLVVGTTLDTPNSCSPRARKEKLMTVKVPTVEIHVLPRREILKRLEDRLEGILVETKYVMQRDREPTPFREDRRLKFSSSREVLLHGVAQLLSDLKHSLRP
ncbi:MAG: hypothetical protein UY71_C0009G0003 [Parcubacteria group bacterium GW2011_GWB1_52_7]|nr:MAG: hypothetical protein UY71_C0009G0003 [Parcubacteria group bacterium GW2011_GWB1_52_7]